MKLLHAEAGEETLIATRRAILAVGLLPLVTQPLWPLAQAPLETFVPPGPLALLPATGREFLLQGTTLWLLPLFTALALVIGIWKARGWSFIVASMLAALGLLLHQGICRGFGHINHAELGLLLLLWALPGYAIADTIQRWRGRPSPACDTLVSITYIFLLSYLLIGALRFVNAPEVFAVHNQWAWMVERTAEGTAGGFFTWEELGRQPIYAWLLALGFPAVTVLELLAPLALVWKGYRYVFLAAMVGFHMGVIIFMRLFFLENVLLLLILLIDWPAIAHGIRAKMRQTA